MLSIYTLTEGKIAPAEKVLPGCWLYAVSPDEGEIKRINEITGIEPDDIKAALDEEERSRIELDGGDDSYLRGYAYRRQGRDRSGHLFDDPNRNN